jgi:hypothetical protein
MPTIMSHSHSLGILLQNWACSMYVRALVDRGKRRKRRGGKEAGRKLTSRPSIVIRSQASLTWKEKHTPILEAERRKPPAAPSSREASQACSGQTSLGFSVPRESRCNLVRRNLCTSEGAVTYMFPTPITAPEAVRRNLSLVPHCSLDIPPCIRKNI